jgi:membrane protein YqaA with SNARE-associated domain
LSEPHSPGASPSQSSTPSTPHVSTSRSPTPRGSRFRTLAPRVLAVVAVGVLLVWANVVAAENVCVLDFVREFGYGGLFLAAAVSGFNLLVPIPVVGFFPLLMDAGLDPVLAVLVIGAGMTVGDMVGYVLGRAGRKLVEKPQWLRRLESVRERRRVAPYLILFFYAGFAPLPNELIVIPMALIGCRWYGVLGAALGGNLIFNSLAAAGFHGAFSAF